MKLYSILVLILISVSCSSSGPIDSEEDCNFQPTDSKNVAEYLYAETKGHLNKVSVFLASTMGYGADVAIYTSTDLIPKIYYCTRLDYVVNSKSPIYLFSVAATKREKVGKCFQTKKGLEINFGKNIEKGMTEYQCDQMNAVFNSYKSYAVCFERKKEKPYLLKARDIYDELVSNMEIIKCSKGTEIEDIDQKIKDLNKKIDGNG